MAPALGTAMLLGKKHRKSIGLVDNIVPHEKHFYDPWLSAYFIASTDAFVVMSRSVKEELRRFTRNKAIRYFPHPVYDIYGKRKDRDTALMELGLDPSFRYLLFFGFIREYKGLDLLLRSMALPAIRQSKLKLIVAGEFYGNREKYLSLINELDIADRVILHTEFIPDQQVHLYFSGAELLVQPYRTATQSGIAQIAYHFELPMVVTRVGGLPEIVEDGKSGFVTDVDPAAISQAVKRYFDEGLQASFSEGARALKEKFSWKNLAGAFLDLQENVN